MGRLTIQDINESSNFLKKFNFSPDIAIVLGSGLGGLVDNFVIKETIPYNTIPNFPQTTVEGHEGKLIFAEKENKKLAILQGRVHAYEGKSLEEVVFPIRVLGMLGIEKLLLTNASGGINPKYSPGDLVIIHDHLNLLGDNPLIGPNMDELGTRFPDMTEAYNKQMIEVMEKAFDECGVRLNKGVYAGLLGPNYETPAEIKMLNILGADMVGMSTVAETIAAHHQGIKVGALSCITNMAAGILNQKLAHEEVKEVANKAIDTFSNIILTTLKHL